MRIAKKQHKIPKKIFVVAAALMIIGGVGLWSLYQSQRANNIASSAQEPIRPANTVNYEPPTQDEQQQQEDTKTDVIRQNEPASPATESSVTVTISRATQGGKGLPLNIRTIVSGATKGTCLVELKKDGQATITRSFPIMVQATYSTCQQADIAANEFGTDGEWLLSITATNETGASKAATGSVTIEK